MYDIGSCRHSQVDHDRDHRFCQRNSAADFAAQLGAQVGHESDGVEPEVLGRRAQCARRFAVCSNQAPSGAAESVRLLLWHRRASDGVECARVYAGARAAAAVRRVARHRRSSRIGRALSRAAHSRAGRRCVLSAARYAVGAIRADAHQPVRRRATRDHNARRASSSSPSRLAGNEQRHRPQQWQQLAIVIEQQRRLTELVVERRSDDVDVNEQHIVDSERIGVLVVDADG